MARRERKGPVESLVTGVVVGTAFILYWVFGGHHPWAIIGALFAGVLPASRGLSAILAARANRPKIERAARLDPHEIEAQDQKDALRVARDKGGRVTPSLLALESDLSVERAERALDALASKGHAALRVRDDGRIEYEFAEFLPQIENRY